MVHTSEPLTTPKKPLFLPISAIYLRDIIIMSGKWRQHVCIIICILVSPLLLDHNINMF